MSKVIIKDNVLPINFNHSIHVNFFAHQGPQQNSWVDKENVPDLFKALIEDAGKYFDFSTAVGYEWWTQKDGSKPGNGWHFDLDEKLFQEEGKIKLPLCSIIYYPTIGNLQGGTFVTEDISIQPRFNRAIYMAPGVKHNVEPFTGTRMSLLINVWSYKLEWATQTFYLKR